MLSTGARVPPPCPRRRWPRVGVVPPFPSPSGAAVPERLLVQVRGCARPRRLPGLVAELLSFRHGVRAGGGRQGWLASGPPCGKAGGERGGGRTPLLPVLLAPIPKCPQPLRVLVLLPTGSGKPWVKRGAAVPRFVPPGQAVLQCPPPRGRGCWHRWPCRASPVGQGGCGGKSHLHPDSQRGREQRPGGRSQGGGDAATRSGATLVPPGGQGQLGQARSEALVPWRHAGQHGTVPASGQAQRGDGWLGDAGDGTWLLCLGQTPVLGFPPRMARGWGDARRAGWGSAFGTRHAGEEGTRRPPARWHCWGRGATPHLRALSSTVPIPTAPIASGSAGPGPAVPYSALLLTWAPRRIHTAPFP